MVLAGLARKQPTQVIGQKPKHRANDLLFSSNHLKPPPGACRSASYLLCDPFYRRLYAVARMNGAKAITETLAKRRLFFAGLPGMSELLPVRSAQKEDRAYAAQLEAEELEQPSAFRPERSQDDDDLLDRTA